MKTAKTNPTDSLASTDGRTVSLWQQTADLPTYPPLHKKLSVDVCVVGAGIAGLTTAFLLLREGKSVAVLDDSAIGDGQTGRTSAHLASAIDDRFFEIANMHGEQAAKICYQSHAAGIDLIELISRDEQIACDFARIDGYLFAAPDAPADYLDKELAAAKKAGAPVDRVDRVPLKEFDSGSALRFPRQARFHPQKYLVGLSNAVKRMGGKIFCDTLVNDVQGGDLTKGEHPTATTDTNHKVTAKAIVVATNAPAPINDWAGIYTKQTSFRSYVIGVSVPKGSVTDALYWDTTDPYHYVRIDQTTNNHDVLLVGGADHKVGQMRDKQLPFEQLEQWTRERFKQAGDVLYRWSGQVQEPDDGVAFIGKAPTAKPNVYVITGDSGMGLTHGTLGAMLVRDLIIGRENTWASLYDPLRKPLHAKTEFIKENLNAMATYVDYVTPGQVSSENDVLPGEGALIREGLKKLAVYREDGGKLHKMSAICPHLGCIVQWNSIEKSWDCPCHGSRFKCTGEVVMGPSVTGLPEVK